MKESTDQIDEKLGKTIFRFPVLHLGWEADGWGYVIEKDGKTHTAQVKPYSTASIDGDKVSLSDTGNVKPYNVNWLIFIQPKTNKILIFDNHPLQNENQYIFKLSSLLHEIE